MNNQNINPTGTKDYNEGQLPKSGNLTKTGLDEWNDRLDENLEPEGQADVQADENAEEFHDAADDEAKPA